MPNQYFSYSRPALTQDTDHEIWVEWIWAQMESVYIVSLFTSYPPTHLHYLHISAPSTFDRHHICCQYLLPALCFPYRE